MVAILDEFGREILDQTPVALPLQYDRPEPLHQRIRRMIIQATQEQNPEYETLEDANDFEIEDDPSSYDTDYTEPDLEPMLPIYKEDVEAARQFVQNEKNSSQEMKDAGGEPGVSSPGSPPAEQA